MVFMKFNLAQKRVHPVVTKDPLLCRGEDETKQGLVRGEGRVEQEFKYQLIFNTFYGLLPWNTNHQNYNYVPSFVPNVTFFPNIMIFSAN